MQGELTLRLSSLWMHIAYISLLFDLFSPLCWWFDKKGERNFWSFIYACLCMFISFLILYKKGEKNFESFIYACLFSCLMHICFVYEKGRSISFLIYAFMCYLIYACHCAYCYAWVKGELLWSLTLIHAYITPWILSSSKRERLLAQRPITLVLMMINSCSYSLLRILCLISFRYLIKILVGL